MKKYYFVVRTKDVQNHDFRYYSQNFDDFLSCEEAACARLVHEFKMSMKFINIQIYAYHVDTKLSSAPIGQFYYNDYH